MDRLSLANQKRGLPLKDNRALSLALFEIAERTTHPDHGANVVAVAKAWLAFAAMDDALTLWADEVKRKMH
jgi:hypothetical protein